MRQEQVGVAGIDPAMVAEITQEDGARLVVQAERLPRGTPVRVRPSEARRLAALMARAERHTERHAEPSEPGPWIEGEPPAELGHELCSAHFLSGAGWAWRVTATLARSRDGDARRPARRRRPRPVPPRAAPRA